MKMRGRLRYTSVNGPNFFVNLHFCEIGSRMKIEKNFLKSKNLRKESHLVAAKRITNRIVCQKFQFMKFYISFRKQCSNLFQHKT